MVIWELVLYMAPAGSLLKLGLRKFETNLANTYYTSIEGELHSRAPLTFYFGLSKIAAIKSGLKTVLNHIEIGYT